MVQINLTINVPSQAEIDDLVTQWGWTATIPDPNNQGQFIPNPLTKLQFAKQKVISFVREALRAKRAQEAIEAAKAAQNTAIDNLSIT